jgi:hypothetical protein
LRDPFEVVSGNVILDVLGKKGPNFGGHSIGLSQLIDKRFFRLRVRPMLCEEKANG